MFTPVFEAGYAIPDQPGLEPLRVGRHRDRTHPARDVDDHGAVRALEQWQKRLRDAHDPEHVRLEHAPHVVGGDLAGGLAGARDASVVDEHIQSTAGRGHDQRGRRGDAVLVGHVELNGPGPDLTGRRLPERRIPRGQPDLVALGQQPPRGLAAEALICTRDERCLGHDSDRPPRRPRSQEDTAA
jgi:hypothetical protein